jgi:hypothetical protein
MSELKLFVWPEWAPDWDDGLAFAIAANEEDARKMIIEKEYDTSSWGPCEVHSLDNPIAFACPGGG